MLEIKTNSRNRVYAYFENYEQLEAFSDKHNGEILLFSRKDGAKVWDEEGYQWGPLKVSEQDYGDNYCFITYNDTTEDIYSTYVAPKLSSFDNIDELHKFVTYWHQIIDDMDVIEEDEALLMENVDGYYKKIDIIKILGTLASIDGKEKIIGVAVDEEAEQEDE